MLCNEGTNIINSRLHTRQWQPTDTLNQMRQSVSSPLF